MIQRIVNNITVTLDETLSHLNEKGELCCALYLHANKQHAGPIKWDLIRFESTLAADLLATFLKGIDE